MSEQIHPLAWWTMRDEHLVGVVALIDRQRGYWKAYIGELHWPHNDEQADALAVVRTGVPAGEAVALALMPPPLVDGLEFRAT